LGIFLSPDNYLQAPDNSQNFNRYTYCLNNPLVYTDPSGEFIHIIIGAAVGGVINLGVKAFQGKIDCWGDGFAAFGIGAAAGAIGAATGGAAFLAAGGAAGGVGGFLAGAAGGAAGTAFASPIQSIGNSAYFGDPMMTGKQYLMGVGIGAFTGGAINGTIALFNGRSFIDGLPVPKPPTITRLPVPVQYHKAVVEMPGNGRAQMNSISGTYSSENPSDLLYYFDNAKSAVRQNTEGLSYTFRDPNFRSNLIKTSGINLGDLYRAHHVFPLKYAEYFQNNGINVNQYGVWWETASHSANASAYNEAWRTFIRSNQSPTQNELFREVLKLKGLFGY
jgi:hypothetical protein